MSVADPADFARAFSNAFSARDLAGIGALFADDADLLSLTGAWAEGREAIEKVFAAELHGALARTKLVSGRSKQRLVAPGATQIMQRFVLSGLLHADGSEAGRLGAVLTALLTKSPGGWRAVSVQFSAEA